MGRPSPAIGGVSHRALPGCDHPVTAPAAGAGFGGPTSAADLPAPQPAHAHPDADPDERTTMRIGCSYNIWNGIGILQLSGYLGQTTTRRFHGAVDWAQFRAPGPIVLDLDGLAGWSL